MRVMIMIVLLTEKVKEMIMFKMIMTILRSVMMKEETKEKQVGGKTGFEIGKFYQKVSLRGCVIERHQES